MGLAVADQIISVLTGVDLQSRERPVTTAAAPSQVPSPECLVTTAAGAGALRGPAWQLT
jgi:hypothetical protein